MKRTVIFFCVGLLVSVMTCGSVWAQGTAQISGTVHDQSGAVLPGVEVTATQADTGISRMTVSNETGVYILPTLPIGPYRLEAALPGFRTFVQRGIVLQVNSNPSINVVLEVGQVSEQVEVEANAALVETRSVSVGQVMETTRIMELPLNGRNAQELLLLGGGASQITPSTQSSSNRMLISSAGSLGTSTEYTLDGIRHVGALDGYPLQFPFPDALAEFKTEIGGLGASQGRGTLVSAVTKSGTNALHGDLFEFVRNDLFNARNYFATKGSTLKRNQFGGTVGGPIITNKLFFFGGYQGTTLRQDPSDVRAFLPTAAMLAGDFTAFTSPACNAGRQIALRSPFVNNRINPALFSPAAVKLSARLPKPNNECGELTYGQKNIENDNQVVSKLDYQLNDKHSLFGRYMYGLFQAPSPFKFTPDNVLNAIRRQWEGYHALTLGSTYLLSPNTVNAFRLSFTRNKTATFHEEYFGYEDVGIKVYGGYVPKTVGVAVTSGFSLPGGPDNYSGELYQLSDNVSMVRGKHQFVFGGRYGYARTIQKHAASARGTFNITGSVTGAGLADFLTGNVSDFNHGLPSRAFSRVKYISLFTQDTWQIKPRLTVNYGVRWAPILPIVDYHRPVGMVTNFDIERYRQGLRSSVFVNAPPGLLFPGDPQFAQKNNGAAKDPKSDVWNAYWNLFAPNIGFAWDVQGDGRTSVRAAYGLNYEDYPTNYRRGTQSVQPPWGSLTRLLAPEGGLDDPWRGVPGGNPFPLNVEKNVPFVPSGEYMPSDPNLTPTYTQTWNLSLQREVVAGTLVSASYIGRQIIHLQASNPLNPSIFVPGLGDANGSCFLDGKITSFRVAPGTACSTVTNTNARRVLSFVNPAYAGEIGRMGILVNGGTQNYNGMLLSMQHRLRQSVNLNGNYTWSHCIGDYMGRSNVGNGTSVDHTYQDPNNRYRDRANCEVDQRHSFNLTGVAETPSFTNPKLRLLASGWRLSGIYRIGTGGSALAVVQNQAGTRTVTLGSAAGGQANAVGTDRCLCDISVQRPDLVLPNGIYLDKSGGPNTQWLNPAAFAMPALGTLGNMGRVNLRVPTAWQFDLSASRTFRFRENQSLEFRAEAYNVLNSFRPGVIDTNLLAANFGKIRTALDPRIMQFALKYLF
jgi:Carboxypeptidase regulatory-like domain